MRLDPGAQVGGNSQVASAAGARLLGVPHRVNLHAGVGPREVIMGGPGHDELGVLGDAGRICGGGGPDLIHGGAGNAFGMAAPATISSTVAAAATVFTVVPETR